MNSLSKASIFTLFLVLAAVANAQLLFTQYYEGTSTNKWLEIKNVGSTSISLADYTISLYTNANAEVWKSGTTSSFNFALSGTLAAGGVYVIGNTANTIPSYATANVNNNTVANYNGNDSIVLWDDTSSFSTSRIVDALSFTNLGNEGADKSFVRLTTGTGYNLVTGSAITGFSSIWATATLTDVANATLGTDNYVGSSTVSAVPEPSTYAAIAGVLALGGVMWRRRRQRAVAPQA